LSWVLWEKRVVKAAVRVFVFALEMRAVGLLGAAGTDSLGGEEEGEAMAEAEVVMEEAAREKMAAQAGILADWEDTPGVAVAAGEGGMD